MKVLLIDDDAKCLKSIGKALSINGIENSQFTNPKAAIESYKLEKFDIVVTDLKMPEMSGLDVLQIIREYNPFAYVIILSAFDDCDSMNAAKKMGAYSFFHKSVKFEDFLETLLTIEKVDR